MAITPRAQEFALGTPGTEQPTMSLKNLDTGETFQKTQAELENFAQLGAGAGTADIIQSLQQQKLGNFAIEGAPSAGPIPAPGTPVQEPGAIAANLNQLGFASSGLPDLTGEIKRLRNEESLAKSEEETRAAQIKKQIEAQYAQREAELRKKGESEISGQEARLGISRGLGFSSSRVAFLNEMKGQLEGQISDLRKDMSSAIANADFAAADRSQARIEKLRDQQFKLQSEAFDQSMKMMQESREKAGEKRTQTEFEQEQEDRTIQSNVRSLINLDKDGNLQLPDIKTLQTIAERLDVDPARLGSAVQKEMERLGELQADEREAALKEDKITAEISATEALEKQRLASAKETEALIPLQESKLRAQIANLSRPPSSGGAGVTSNTAQKLLDSRGEDGYVNTEVYSEAFDEAVLAGPTALANFKKQIPTDVFLNPNDATASRYLEDQKSSTDLYNLL